MFVCCNLALSSCLVISKESFTDISQSQNVKKIVVGTTQALNSYPIYIKAEKAEP